MKSIWRRMNRIPPPARGLGPSRLSGGGLRWGRTLPLRLWLILAVAAIIGAGFLAQVGLTAVMAVWNHQAEQARMGSIRQIIGTNPGAWRRAAWQRHAAASLDALGVNMALYTPHSGASGQLVLGAAVYATTGAGQLLGAGGAGTNPSGFTPSPLFERLVLTHNGRSPASLAPRVPIGVALLWLAQPPPGELPQELWPAVELGMFGFTLAVVVWLVGLPVLRPLAELNRAAESMAGGDLNVHFSSPSPVREIAEVSAALEGTSAALRESLARQVALEEDRRLFISAIAHDLRTPLFMLRGYLKGLEYGVAATPDKIAHYLAMCSTQADALERRIADLFTFTRLEYLEQEPERAPVEMRGMLAEMVEIARPLAATKRIELALEGPAGPCMVLGDRRLLARAIGNLLDNALRYTPDCGRIVVRWGPNDGKVSLAVEDSGPGIAAHDLPHLFTPLYRGEESRNRQTGGAGLGLTIAQRILRAHGGELTASNAPSGGAVFTVALGGEAGDVFLAEP